VFLDELAFGCGKHWRLLLRERLESLNESQQTAGQS
jgi:hypothetical protein